MIVTIQQISREEGYLLSVRPERRPKTKSLRPKSKGRDEEPSLIQPFDFAISFFKLTATLRANGGEKTSNVLNSYL